MRIGKEPKNWIRAVVIGAVLGPATVSAEFPRLLETAGRLHGVCWGDGYHACASSGLRIGADLPPMSYSASHGSRSHAKPTGIVHRIGATYYDRFDAANARACDAPKCDSNQCDSNQCDSGQCDCGTVSVIDGSQVIQAPGVMSPTIIQPKQLQWAPLTTVASDAAKAPSPLPDPVTELTQPLTLAPQAKKQPTRPEPPTELQRSNVIPVASKQKTFGVELPAPENEFRAPGDGVQAISDRPKSQPHCTTTPGSIELIHPGSPPAVPARLALPSNPNSTLTPSMVVPAPTALAQPEEPKVASAPAPTELAQPEEPKVASAPAPTELAQPAKPVVASATAHVPAFVPSYAIAPYDPPTTIQVPATKQVATKQVATKQVAANQPQARPVPLGTATTPEPTAAIKSVAVVQRPTRLGDGGVVAQVNPFATRPVVEMAKRVGESSDGVIFQPSGGSLK